MMLGFVDCSAATQGAISNVVAVSSERSWFTEDLVATVSGLL